MLKIEDYLNHLRAIPNIALLSEFHSLHKELIDSSYGSKLKHQSWAGGYRHHLEQCLDIALTLFNSYNFSQWFYWDDVLLVLYLHDIEKIWKYTTGEVIDKTIFYEKILPLKYGVQLSPYQLNALKYIHGEGEDYCEYKIMNELAAFCHSCDIMSARIFHNKTNIFSGLTENQRINICPKRKNNE